MKTIETQGKKLIYVTACGRSGTTIFGYLLGNVRGVIDLGEVNEWLRFNGKPNGFGAGTENHDFWDHVMARFIDNWGSVPDFDALRQLQRRVDYHFAMMGQIISGYAYRARECKEFRFFLRALYQAIFDASDAHYVIDSSKYPSRLWHLTHIFPAEDLLTIHLRRSAGDVVRAMQTTGQGTPRAKLTAAAYYYGVEFMIGRVLKKSLLPVP